MQITHLKTRFELAENSVLAEKAVVSVNKAFEDYETATETIRVKPREMVIEYRGEKVIIPLLKPQ